MNEPARDHAASTRADETEAGVLPIEQRLLRLPGVVTYKGHTVRLHRLHDSLEPYDDDVRRPHLECALLTPKAADCCVPFWRIARTLRRAVVDRGMRRAPVTTLTKLVVFALLASNAALEARAEEGTRGAGCCGDTIRNIARLYSASEERDSHVAVEARWSHDVSRPDVWLVDDVDFDTARTPSPRGRLAEAIVRECERLDYRSKLRSAFKEIGRLHAEFGRDGFKRAFVDYVANKAVAPPLNAVQRSIPIKVSATLSGNDMVFRLHSPCGFNLELAKAKVDAARESGKPVASQRRTSGRPDGEVLPLREHRCVCAASVCAFWGNTASAALLGNCARLAAEAVSYPRIVQLPP